MAYFVVVSDLENFPKEVYWMKNTDRAYSILKDLVECSDHRFTASKIKSVGHDALCKIANQSLLTLTVTNPLLECPSTLLEISQVAKSLADNGIIKESLIGDELRSRWEALNEEKRSLVKSSQSRSERWIVNKRSAPKTMEAEEPKVKGGRMDDSGLTDDR